MTRVPQNMTNIGNLKTKLHFIHILHRRIIKLLLLAEATHTYTIRKYGVWAFSFPFPYLEKSLKVEKRPKALGVLS